MSLPPAPPPPHVDDYDSDESAVIPGTRREAGHHVPPSKPLMQHMRKQGRDAASDSGYSSHASNTVASSTYSQPTAGAQHVRQSSQPVNQNTIGRRDSQRGPSRSSRSSSVCTDPRCGDPKCSSTQSTYALPHRPQTQRSQTTQYPVQDPGPPLPPTQASNYPYPPHLAGQPAPNYYHPQAEARPRAPSASQGRPTSWAPGAYPYANLYQPGNPAAQGNYSAQPHTLPPSPSTYARIPHMAQYSTTSAEWQGMPPQMISGSPRDSFGAYMPGQPMAIPSNSQHYPPAPYSARQGNPATLSQEISIPATGYRQSTEPTISARRASIMPGSFPGEPAAFGSASESSSESSDSEDDRNRQRYEQSRRREQSLRRRDQERDRARRALEDRKAMPPPSRERERERERRPTLTHTRTTPVDSRHRSREPPRRAPYSDPDISSSDYVDSDRTTRPVVSKRLTYSNSRELRRPAIHHESSGREKSSSISHSSHATRQYVVEDANGRKLYYDTREEAENKASRLNQQRREDEAEAYIANKRGNPHPATLTTDNVKRSQTQQERKPPASHASGSSKKSTVSSRTSATRTSTADSTIQIKRGDAVYTIPADRTVNIITKEGETMTIGPGSPPREKSYHGGSSDSRTGRSRNGSEYGGRRRDTITEEHDGYESAM